MRLHLFFISIWFNITFNDSTKSTANREEKQGSVEVVGEKAADIRKYMKAVTLAFVSQSVSSARDYKIFLTPEYANQVSTKSFPIRVVILPFLNKGK